MAKAKSSDDSLARVAANQLSVVTLADGVGAGLSDDALSRRRGAGRLVTVRRGVSRIAGAPVSWEQTVLAACLAAGAHAVASHLTAACLYCFLRVARPPMIDLCVPVPHQHRLRGVRTHRVLAIDAKDVTRVERVPATTAARTVVDIASLVRRKDLDAIVNDLIRRRLLTVDGLAACIVRAERARLRRPYALLHELVEKRSKGFHPGDSDPELWIVDTLVAAGLPKPVQQHPVRASGRNYRLDTAYPELRIGMEYDGVAGHGLAIDLAPDRRRQNDLSSAGWDMRYFTNETTDRALVSDVRAAIRRAGAQR